VALPPQIGRYDVLLPLARNATVSVYLAQMAGPGGFAKDLAIKLVHAATAPSDEVCASLLEEAKLAAQIHHPHVVSVVDAGQDPSGVFLVMEYVEGDSLARLFNRGAVCEKLPSLPVALRILVDALEGLHAAHTLTSEAGAPLEIVHRDFSPGNILVGLDGIAKLTDFGIARSASRTSYTRHGIVKGKLRYLAPEQARADSLDRRSDIWAAGVVGWELLAGQRLYPAGSDLTAIARMLSEPPPRLSTLRPDVPSELDEAIASALTPELDRRCSSAAELRDRLIAASEPLGGLASREQVAAYVEAISGPWIRDRRRRAREMLELRQSMARLLEPGASDDDSSSLLTPAISLPRPSQSAKPRKASNVRRLCEVTSRPSASLAVAFLALLGAICGVAALIRTAQPANPASPRAEPVMHQPSRR
jgi:eukaryotic-like serine/threonine-protein kinase